MIDDATDAMERALFTRLGEEHGLTTPCPKCLLHELGLVVPDACPEDMFRSTDPLGGVFDWSKTRMDAVGRTYPVTLLPAARALAILTESDTMPGHGDHLPEAALEQPAILVEVRVGSTTRNVFGDGNHRATRLARAGRPVPIHWIRARAEPQCRVRDDDFARSLTVAQRNGFLVWEVPIQYAITTDADGRQRFGRLVVPEGAVTAYFQAARNAHTLVLPAGLPMAARGGMVELGLDARACYAPVARAAQFSPTLRVGGRDQIVVPVPHGRISADVPRRAA